jgi:hypothetical protein
MLYLHFPNASSSICVDKHSNMSTKDIFTLSSQMWANFNLAGNYFEWMEVKYVTFYLIYYS